MCQICQSPAAGILNMNEGKLALLKRWVKKMTALLACRP